ncbi:hypothetical protein SDC9_110365 [bioreactor metagenome]
MVIKGIMTGELPWALVFVGASIAVFCQLAGLPILPVALGLYLPIHLNAGILVGGIVRVLVERKFKNNEETKKNKVEAGILLASGLVAGDALMGIVVAGIATAGLNIGFGATLLPALTGNAIFSTAMYFLLGLWVYNFSVKSK